MAKLPETTRGICVATVILLVLFLLVALWRVYPFVDNVTVANSTGDDWLHYKLYALSILHGGLLLPAVQGSYFAPAGFLYNYFIAAVFALTGENSTHVYLVQAALLALSVGLMTLAFKSYLSIRTRVIYFWALALAVVLDVYIPYTFRLLSENLALILLPIFYLTLFRAYESRSLLLSACAGAALGLCALCRPNLLLVAPTTTLLIYLRPRPRRAICALMFIVCCGVVFSLLPLRNYAVVGRFSLPIFATTGFWQTPATAASIGLFGKVLAVVVFYARRILFCSGVTLLELSPYWLRPHWPFIWAGALIYVWRALKRRLEFWELFTMSFIVIYLAPVIAFAQISNYGVRMILPVMPLVLLLAVQALGRQAVVGGRAARK